jgi:hypothetical protein
MKNDNLKWKKIILAALFFLDIFFLYIYYGHSWRLIFGIFSWYVIPPILLILLFVFFYKTASQKKKILFITLLLLYSCIICIDISANIITYKAIKKEELKRKEEYKECVEDYYKTHKEKDEPCPPDTLCLSPEMNCINWSPID